MAIEPIRGQTTPAPVANRPTAAPAAAAAPAPAAAITARDLPLRPNTSISQEDALALMRTQRQAADDARGNATAAQENLRVGPAPFTLPADVSTLPPRGSIRDAARPPQFNNWDRGGGPSLEQLRELNGMVERNGTGQIHRLGDLARHGSPEMRREALRGVALSVLRSDDELLRREAAAQLRGVDPEDLRALARGQLEGLPPQAVARLPERSGGVELRDRLLATLPQSPVAEEIEEVAGERVRARLHDMQRYADDGETPIRQQSELLRVVPEFRRAGIQANMEDRQRALSMSDALRDLPIAQRAARLAQNDDTRRQMDPEAVGRLMERVYSNPGMIREISEARREAVAALPPERRQQLANQQVEYVGSPDFQHRLNLLNPEERQRAAGLEMERLSLVTQDPQHRDRALALFSQAGERRPDLWPAGGDVAESLQTANRTGTVAELAARAGRVHLPPFFNRVSGGVGLANALVSGYSNAGEGNTLSLFTNIGSGVASGISLASVGFLARIGGPAFAAGILFDLAEPVAQGIDNSRFLERNGLARRQ